MEKPGNAVEQLRAENLELKFTAIRKDVSNLKTDLNLQLERIYAQTSQTNENVAKALERIYALERQDNKSKIEELRKEFEHYKKDTAFWHLIARHKWIAGLIVLLMYLMTITEVKELIFSLLRLA